MTTKLQQWIDDRSYPDIVIVMVILCYWILGKITAEECAGFTIQVSYTFNTTAYTVTNGTDTYTVYQMLSMTCSDTYPVKANLGLFVMKTVLKSAKTKLYITADQYTELVAKL